MFKMNLKMKIFLKISLTLIESYMFKFTIFTKQNTDVFQI